MKQWKLIFTVLMSLLLVCTCMSALAEETCEHKQTYDVLYSDYPCLGVEVVDKYCTECGDLVKEKATQARPAGEQHVWDKGVEVKETCEKGSYTKYSCLNCDETKEVAGDKPATQHSPVVKTTVEATCTTDGEKQTICQYCNKVFGTEKIDKLNHPTDKQKVFHTTPATCAAEGLDELKCTLCNKVLDSWKVDKLAHAETEYVTVEPTCTTDGSVSEVCKACKTVVSGPTKLDKTGHKNQKTIHVSTATCTSEGLDQLVCLDCDAVLDSWVVSKLSHSKHTVVTVKEPTCTEKGEKAYKCGVCGTLENNFAVDAKGHGKTEYVTVKATCTTDGSVSEVCTVCKAVVSGPVKLDKTNHANKKTVHTKVATCTEEGLDTLTCLDCGAELDSWVISKLSHSKHTVVTVKEPTCTEKGEKAYKCGVCGTLENNFAVDAKGHGKTEYVTVKPTCTTDGSVSEVCTVCKAVVSGPVKLDKTNHANKKTVHTKVATCTEEGLDTLTCLDCGAELDSWVVAKLGHEIETIAVTKADCEGFNHKVTAYNKCKVCNVITYKAEKADYDKDVAEKVNGCGVEGYSAHKACSICGAAKPNTKTIYPALTHEYTIQVGYQAADCLNDGYRVMQCKVRNIKGEFCDATKNEVIPALGHDHGDLWSVKVPATCTENGIEENLCLHCGLDAQYRDIPATGHNYYSAAEIVKDYSKAVSGTVVAPTCEKDGSAYAICKNGCQMTHGYEDNAYVVLPKLGHKMSAWSISSYTCTEGTVGTRECSNGCGLKETKVFVEPKGHNWLITGGVEATCVKSGLVNRQCAACGAKETNVWVPANGHTEKVETTAATCTVAGKEVVTCSVCGTKISEKVLPATGHVETKDVQTKAPTCTEKGAADVVCVACGVKTGTKEVAALGHGTTKEVVAKEATCTEKGSINVVCTVCDKVVEVKEVAAKGHGATKEVETLAPTCTEKGSIDVICTVCNAVVETKEVAALGHGDAVVVETAPTCTEDGKVEEFCSVCDELLNTTAVPATGHDKEEVVVSEPSVEGPGLVRIQCSVCGVELGAYWVQYTDEKINVKVNSDGVLVADLAADADVEETRVALIDLSVEGKTEYVLVADDNFVIGTMVVEVAGGKLTISYNLLSGVVLSDGLLTIYADVAALTAQTGTEYVEEVVELDIASTFGADSKIILAYAANASFDAADCEYYVVDAEAVEAMKLLAD